MDRVDYDSRVQQNMQTSELRLHRTLSVFNEFLSFSRTSQTSLASMAIGWALASLAEHRRRDEYRTQVNCLIDMMYAETEAARGTLGDSEIEALSVGASAVVERFRQESNSILQESYETIRKYDRTTPAGLVGWGLSRILLKNVEAAPSELLLQLTARCLSACVAIDVLLMGGNNEKEVTQKVTEVGYSVLDITKSVESSSDRRVDPPTEVEDPEGL